MSINLPYHYHMNNSSITAIRPFIGARNFDESRAFYELLDFVELKLGPTMSYFRLSENIGFYLQNAYVKDWVDNTMLFLEADDLDRYHEQLTSLDLADRFKGVRLSGIKTEDWGREFFLHDPSGILWHIGEFK